MTKDEINLLRAAKNEIQVLRNHNNVMGIRLKMFDDLMLVLRTKPDMPAQGFAPDIVYDIDKYLAGAESEDKR